MKKLPLIAGASALLLAAAVYAAPAVIGGKTDADGNGMVSKSEAMAAADSRFAKLDVNGDGVVNATDKDAKLKLRFAEMDTDKNGALTQAEFVANFANKSRDRNMAKNGEGEGRRHGGRGGHGMKMLQNADTNGDQAVTRDEFRAAFNANFTKADSNGDGSLSDAERQAMRKQLRGDRHGGRERQG